MKLSISTFVLTIGILAASQTTVAQETPAPSELKKAKNTVRFATFNVSFNRKTKGALVEELKTGASENAKRIAKIIRTVRPDVLLLNEFDWDKNGAGIASFQTKYLEVAIEGEALPIHFEFVYFQSVNTGVDTGLDLNSDGKTETASDAFGYGNFPGQYGMVVLSRYPIDVKNVRTFQKFLWKDMPGNLLPIDPKTKKPYYNNQIKKIFRLSSKSHWDVPIRVNDKTIHFLVAHPTPPVFDRDEDRNGRRNHDEIRLFADYVTPGKSDYLYDDNGKKGGLARGTHFVIAGDMNADPFDGESSLSAKLLVDHALICGSPTPQSEGGVFFAKQQGQKNTQHAGNPSWDTSDFNDTNVGNLRIDYCLPSQTLTLKNCGVYWPVPGQPGSDLVTATDHRMVWVDLQK